MSYAVLRSLPYDESENNSSFLPTRLMRPPEGRQSASVVELKFVLEETSKDITPSLSRIVENNGVPPTFPSPHPLDSDKYPGWIITVFGYGVVILVIGLILLG